MYTFLSQTVCTENFFQPPLSTGITMTTGTIKGTPGWVCSYPFFSLPIEESICFFNCFSCVSISASSFWAQSSILLETL